MDAPTADEVRERSPLLAGRYPSPAKDDELTVLIATTAPLVGAITGRLIAEAPPEGEEVPPGMVELAKRAIAMKTEELDSALGTAEDREAAIEQSKLRSIAAGSWSESYWSPSDMVAGKALDSDPVLAQILWVLCTPEKQAEWIGFWDPEHAPGFSVIEAFNYAQRPGNYSTRFGGRGY